MSATGWHTHFPNTQGRSRPSKRQLGRRTCLCNCSGLNHLPFFTTFPCLPYIYFLPTTGIPLPETYRSLSPHNWNPSQKIPGTLFLQTFAPLIPPGHNVRLHVRIMSALPDALPRNVLHLWHRAIFGHGRIWPDSVQIIAPADIPTLSS